MYWFFAGVTFVILATVALLIVANKLKVDWGDIDHVGLVIVACCVIVVASLLWQFTWIFLSLLFAVWVCVKVIQHIINKFKKEKKPDA